MPWQALAEAGAVFRSGQLNLVAAAPNGGKTAFALSYAVQSRARTLYFSADTDTHTMAVRLCAAVSGVDLATAEASLNQSEMTAALGEAAHIRFCADSELSIGDIHDEIRAWLQLYGPGLAPELIVIDNVVNVAGKGDNPWLSARWVVDQLRKIARATGAHVMCLAHATGMYDDGETAIPLGGLENKIGKNADLVLTLDRSGYEMRVRIVKQRSGRAHQGGDLYAVLLADMSRMDIRDWPKGPWRLPRT